MLKSTIVKWAVAAMLAVPAVPMLGKTIHHRLVSSHRTHRLLTVKSHRHVTRTHRRLSLSAHRKLSTRHHPMMHHLTRKSGPRHESMTSTSHFRVHVTKMPPTIDGINT
jgi:hypothetical protein